MSSIIGNQKWESKFSTKAIRISKNINKWMWNEKDGLYYDVKDSGEQNPVKTSACFWPMLTSIPTTSQAEKMFNNLQDSTTFSRLIPFATLAADFNKYNPVDGYWLGSVWAPTNYMIIKGLENFGFFDFSYLASVKYLRGMGKVYNQTGTVWENYNPDSYNKSERAKPDFVGWTGLGPIAILIESVIGIKVDAPSNTIQWHVNRIDKHGIKNLHFGKAKISILADKRNSQNEELKVTIQTDNPILLKIYKSNKEKEFNIKKGISHIKF